MKTVLLFSAGLILGVAVGYTSVGFIPSEAAQDWIQEQVCDNRPIISLKKN
jgi:hypothetical protein